MSIASKRGGTLQAHKPIAKFALDFGGFEGAYFGLSMYILYRLPNMHIIKNVYNPVSITVLKTNLKTSLYLKTTIFY